MNMSMNGLRRSMVQDFNATCRAVAKLNDDASKKEIVKQLQQLRQEVGALLCIRDPEDKEFTFLYNELKVYDFEERTEL